MYRITFEHAALVPVPLLHVIRTDYPDCVLIPSISRLYLSLSLFLVFSSNVKRARVSSYLASLPRYASIPRAREKCHTRGIIASISTRITPPRTKRNYRPDAVLSVPGRHVEPVFGAISAWIEKLEIMCIWQSLLLTDCSRLTCDYRYKTSFIGSQRSQWVAFNSLFRFRLFRSIHESRSSDSLTAD